MKVLAIVLALSSSLSAQSNGRALVRTFGQFDSDGTIQYAVYVASQEDALGDLTIAAALPRGVRYLETVHKPAGATYEGVSDNTIFWTVSELERDALLGPFVFRVKRESADTPVPATIRAAVAHQRPFSALIESPEPQGTLQPLAERGSVTFGPAGTLDGAGANLPVPVGATGVILFVPEGAVNQQTTMTFRRVPVDPSKLPQTDPPNWWCAQFEIFLEPVVTFNKAISFSMPTRRPVTPGFAINAVISADGTNWTSIPEGKQSGAALQRHAGFGAGGGQFGCSGFGFGGFACGGQFGGGFGFGGGGGQFGGGFGFGAGYVEQDNIRSKIAGSQLGATGASSAANLLTSPPSIIAILIGVR